VQPGAHAWPFVSTCAPEATRAAGRKSPLTNRALDFERNRIAVVMIRLARFGARKQPYYRIVAIEKDRARNGRSIEVVGTYNPRTNPATVDLKHDRIAYWRSVGAQFSDIVEKLVAKNPAGAAPAAPLTPSSPVKAAVQAPVVAAVEAPAPVEAETVVEA
jgi:small subunit ribosomal protein S16